MSHLLALLVNWAFLLKPVCWNWCYLQQKESQLTQKSNTVISGLWGTEIMASLQSPSWTWPGAFAWGLKYHRFRSSSSTCYSYVLVQVIKRLQASVSSRGYGAAVGNACSGFWRNGRNSLVLLADDGSSRGPCGAVPPHWTLLTANQHLLYYPSAPAAPLGSCFLSFSSWLSNHTFSSSSPSSKMWVSFKVLAWACMSSILVLSSSEDFSFFPPLHAGHHAPGCPNKGLGPGVPQMSHTVSLLQNFQLQTCFLSWLFSTNGTSFLSIPNDSKTLKSLNSFPPIALKSISKSYHTNPLSFISLNSPLPSFSSTGYHSSSCHPWELGWAGEHSNCLLSSPLKFSQTPVAEGMNLNAKALIINLISPKIFHNFPLPLECNKHNFKKHYLQHLLCIRHCARHCGENEIKTHIGSDLQGLPILWFKWLDHKVWCVCTYTHMCSLARSRTLSLSLNNMIFLHSPQIHLSNFNLLSCAFSISQVKLHISVFSYLLDLAYAVSFLEYPFL